MPKVTKFYECDVCGKAYNFHIESASCEESHSKKEHPSTIREQLVEIRETSKSFDELNQRAAKVLRAEYGNDFNIFVPPCGSYHWATCTYTVSKKVKKNDPYRYSDTRIRASEILEELGFKTGCGNGDGKVYSYHASSYGSRGSYPAMEALAKERNLLVAEVNDNIKELAKTSVDSLYQKEDFRFLDKEIEKVDEEIRELEARRQGLKNQQAMILGSAATQFEERVAELVVDLPKKTGCGFVELEVTRPIDVWANNAKRRME